LVVAKRVPRERGEGKSLHRRKLPPRPPNAKAAAPTCSAQPRSKFSKQVNMKGAILDPERSFKVERQ
jgi:hypothetical protein